MSTTTPPSSSLTGYTLEITSPLDDETVGQTVTVCGTVGNAQRKGGDTTLEDDCDKVFVSGGGQSCTATLSLSGTFCCDLTGMTVGDTSIVATYTCDADEASDTIMVHVQGDDDDDGGSELTTP